MIRALMRRCAGLAAVLGIAGLAVFLVSIRYLPFQDLPNHIKLLSIARSLRPAGATEYLESPTFLVWGYSLHVTVDRLLAPLFSSDLTVRAIMIVSALAIPLAVGRMATAAGASMSAGVLVALPLALAWPVRMGLVPYVLAIPFLLALMAPVIAICENQAPSKRKRLLIEASVLATLCYLSHALVFIFAAIFVGLAWAMIARFRWRAGLQLAGALLCGAVLAALDRVHGAFEQIPGTAWVWRSRGTVWRPLKQAFAHILTRSYGVSGVGWLAFYLPLLALLLVLCVVAVLPRHRGDRYRVRVFLLSAGLIGTLGTLAVPETIGLAYLVGQRIPILGFAFLSALVALAWDRSSGWMRALLIGSAAVAVVASATDISRRARSVGTILAGGQFGQLTGRFLTARINDCPTPQPVWTWGNYHSEWHLWAYALSDGGVTPYLFAYARYLPVWFRSEPYATQLFAPADGASNSPWSPRVEACADNNRERAVRVLRSPVRFDGVIMFGSPSSIENLMSGLRVPKGSFRRIASGVLAFMPEG